jgi:dihydrofolate synthase/folylpolyglutamate synthase
MRDALQAGLDYLFSFYEQGYQRQLGKFDRQVRCPHAFLRMASALALLPAPSRTVLVTGSKGKGTCARLLAHYLRQAGYRVGLVLTPEELTHLDRIRLNGRPIGATDFLAALESLKPILACPSAVADFSDGRLDQSAYYHPPTAIFLLIALHYFKQTGLDYVVIEGGRGAQHDEIGRIPAAVGIVTSILPEHLGRLGPTLADVCADKFSLLHNCATLVCSTQAFAQAQQLPVHQALTPDALARVRIAAAAHDAGAEVDAANLSPAVPPAWFAIANGLALGALTALGVALPTQSAAMTVSPSCQRLDAGNALGLRPGVVVFLDGAVTPECLDLAYLRSPQCRPNVIVVGLTEDKDVDGMRQFLRAHDFQCVFEFKPVSRLGDIVRAVPMASLGAVDLPCAQYAGVFDKTEGLDPVSRAAFDAIVQQHERIYVIGVQVFLRAVRQALGVTALSGEERPMK